MHQEGPSATLAAEAVAAEAETLEAAGKAADLLRFPLVGEAVLQ